MTRRKTKTIQQFECDFCHQAFTPKVSRQRFCSAAHQTQHRTVKRSETRDARRGSLTCLGCSTPIVTDSRGAIPKRCTPCGQQHKRNMDAKRATVKSSKLKADRLKVVRLCVDCPSSIADRAPQVLRCLPCRAIFVRARDTRAQREKREREKQGKYPVKVLASVKQRVTDRKLSVENLNKRQPPRRAPSGLVAPKQPRNKIMPNLQGDWYPGWNGCYSNNLSPLAVELLKGETGRPHIKTTNQTMQSSGHDRVLRRPSNIPEDLVTIQVAEKRKAG